MEISLILRVLQLQQWFDNNNEKRLLLSVFVLYTLLLLDYILDYNIVVCCRMRESGAMVHWHRWALECG